MRDNIHWVNCIRATVRRVHPGLSPLSADGATTYVSGLLPRLVEQMTAVAEADRLPVILVLDEINRTDLQPPWRSLSLLENRDALVLLPGFDAGDASQELALPHNLFVIGTMNLIDQSVEELDFALRRRFLWRPAGFDPTPIITVNEQRWPTHAPAKWGWNRAVGDMTRLAERAVLLNQQIARSPHLDRITSWGTPTSSMPPSSPVAGCTASSNSMAASSGPPADGRAPRSRILWTFSLEPLLAQYLGGLHADTATAELARLRTVLMTGKIE